MSTNIFNGVHWYLALISLCRQDNGDVQTYFLQVVPCIITIGEPLGFRQLVPGYTGSYI